MAHEVAGLHDHAEAPLFRPQALPQLSEYGVPLGVASGWSKLYAAALVAALVACACEVICGSYSRKALVSGFVVPDKGLIKVQPPHSGRVTEELVAEGQHVDKDQPLYVLDVSGVTALGRTGDLLADNLRRQRQMIVDELGHLAISQVADADHLNANIEALKQQVIDIDAELVSRGDFEHLAENEFERIRALEAKDFASHATRDQVEEAMVNAKIQIAALQTQLGTIKGQFAQAQADWRGLADKQANDRSQLERSREQIDQQLMQIEEQRSLIVRASAAGTITQMTVHVGANVDAVSTPIAPLLTIVPDGATLLAYLYVPSTAIGFARIGGNVLLRYDAYPFEKFGLQEASVASISRTAVNPRELPFPPMGDDPYYLVTATLAKNTVTAFGEEEPVQPGMKFQADLILENRKLWEWAIEPVLASQHSL